MDAPSNLVANGLPSQVKLNWTAVAGATSYVVKKLVSTSPVRYVPIWSGTTTTFTDNVPTGQTAYYAVVASNINGESENATADGTAQ